MSMDYQILPPEILGFWTRTLRLASNWSQDALAEASGLTARTVQRVESGERVSLTTRRCLARGLGYDDPDTFDNPTFVGTIVQLIESLTAKQVQEEEACHPNHRKLAVERVADGAKLGGLIDQSEASVFHCDEQADPEAQQEAAAFFDLLRDYGDIWSELTHSDRLEAQRSFNTALADLASLGLRAYQASRDTKIFGAHWENEKPVPLTIGYVTLVPAELELKHILVPKRS